MWAAAASLISTVTALLAARRLQTKIA